MFCLFLNIDIKCCNWSENSYGIVFLTQDNLILEIFIKIHCVVGFLQAKNVLFTLTANIILATNTLKHIVWFIFSGKYCIFYG